MDWWVSYWEGSLPLRVITSDEVGWHGLPQDGVVEVGVIIDDANRCVLRGLDNYWIHGRHFGCYNDPENSDEAVSYRVIGGHRITGGRIASLGRTYPPQGAHVIRGVMLPDDVAGEVGLL